MKCNLVDKTNPEIKYVDFGIKDKLNRNIGVNITTYHVTFAQAPEDARMWYAIDAGDYYALHTWITRDGKNYGAIQPNKYFKTAQERETAINKYLTETRKRH